MQIIDILHLITGGLTFAGEIKCVRMSNQRCCMLTSLTSFLWWVVPAGLVHSCSIIQNASTTACIEVFMLLVSWLVSCPNWNRNLCNIANVHFQFTGELHPYPAWPKCLSQLSVSEQLWWPQPAEGIWVPEAKNWNGKKNPKPWWFAACKSEGLKPATWTRLLYFAGW